MNWKKRVRCWLIFFRLGSGVCWFLMFGWFVRILLSSIWRLLKCLLKVLLMFSSFILLIWRYGWNSWIILVSWCVWVVCWKLMFLVWWRVIFILLLLSRCRCWMGWLIRLLLILCVFWKSRVKCLWWELIIVSMLLIVLWSKGGGDVVNFVFFCWLWW